MTLSSSGPIRSVVVLCLAAGAISGCGGSGDDPDNAAQPTAQVTTSAPQPSTTAPSVPLPKPNAKLPKDPAKLAASLERTEPAAKKALGEWTDHDKPPPDAATLLTLHEQRIYRLLAQQPQLARQTFAKLPPDLAKSARANVTATKNLFSLADPVKDPSKLRSAAPPPAETLLGHFKKAARRYKLDWRILASLMFVETKFGRVRSPSSTGALGPMQFMPGTWRQYGKGDVHDPGDAVMAAARYLSASGAPRNYDRAIFAYNRADVYVEAVKLHAREIKRDQRNYYAYYCWQAFVRTTRGDVRLTGPKPLN